MSRTEGNVVAEFVGVIVALLLPLSYLSGACWEVARTQLALRTAAHAAARAYVLASTSSEAARRVAAVTSVALREAGVPVAGTRRTLRCSQTPCLTPGGYVTVQLSRSVTVHLPGSAIWVAELVAADTAVVDVLR